MRGDVLGSIGLAISHLHGASATIQKVEGSFNFVWRVEPAARSFGAPLHRVFEHHDRRARPAGGRRSGSWAPRCTVPRPSGCTPSRIWAGSCIGIGRMCPTPSSPSYSPSCTPLFPIPGSSFAPRSSAESPQASSGPGRPDVHRVHRVLLADGGGLYRLRHRAHHAHLGLLELAHPADRRRARLLRAVSAISAARPRIDPSHGQRARAARPVGHVPDRARLRAGAARIGMPGGSSPSSTCPASRSRL